MQGDARPDPYSIPLNEIDLLRSDLFLDDYHLRVFERLRAEDPVHFQNHPIFGRVWNVTRYEDIIAVDTNHETFSSEGSITIDDVDEAFPIPMFIAMDPPRHDQKRRSVSGIAAPSNLVKMEPTIRATVQSILDALPLEEPFNWVDLVSIELTSRMLAILFDVPFEDRRRLTWWSDVATSNDESGIVANEEERRVELAGCLEYFTRLWNERVNEPPRGDLVSLLAHGEFTRDMGPMEFLGNLILLIVGGNDTIRNSSTAGVKFLNDNPEEYQKLRKNPLLIPNMVQEIIRYQTPVAYMRRTAVMDTELKGQRILKGDKVLIWYVSGNRDSDSIEEADRFRIDRRRAGHHLSFGFGIHRCMGSRLAEMQLRILWEEILRRFHAIEVVGKPQILRSNFVRGYTALPVMLKSL